MATAVKNIAGMALAPLGAFNAPIISSNVQTIHVLGTTGAQLNTFRIQNTNTGFPFFTPRFGTYVLAVPTTSGDPVTGLEGKNIVVIIRGSSSPETIVTLNYTATTVSTGDGYDVASSCDKSCPLVTAFLPGTVTQMGTVTLSISNPSDSTTYVDVRVLIYPD